MTPLGSPFREDLSAALELALQGSFAEAAERLAALQPRADEPLSQLALRLEVLIGRLAKALGSQEAALASVQTSLWTLEAAQEQLRLSEERYRSTLDSIGDGLVCTDATGRIDFLNPVAAALTAWPSAEAIGKPSAEIFRILDTRTRTAAADPVQRVLADGLAIQLDEHTELLARDGTRHAIATSCAPIRSTGGQLLGAVLVFRDVTYEYRQRQSLRESEARYRILIDESRDAMLTLLPLTWRCGASNPAARRMFAVADDAEMRKLGLIDLSPPQQPDGRSSSTRLNDAIVLTLREGSTVLSWTHRARDGKEFKASLLLMRMELNGGTIIQATIRDLTAQQQLEAELAQARKLEAVGQLAAGIAHEINTPAQFVGDSLHFLADCFHDTLALLDRHEAGLAALPDSPATAALAAELAAARLDADLDYIRENADPAFARAHDGVHRIATIVGAMKEFAHPDEREKSPADLNRALENTLTIARNEYKYIADVDTDFGDIPLVTCRLGELNQVFLNLLINAAHAIADAAGDGGDRGKISVRTRVVDDMVRIDVADTGNGIPEAIRERVFEPFFTTKAVGRGSGQGLAIARSVIVDKHGGAIDFRSEMGRGTTFTVLLPVAPSVGGSRSTSAAQLSRALREGDLVR